MARWVAAVHPIQWPCVAAELHLDPLYCEAIAHSFELYAPHCDNSGDDSAPDDVIQQTTVKGNSSIIRVEMKMCDTTFVSIVNGVYWRWPVLGPISLGQSSFHDLTLSLREEAYFILK